MEQIPPEKEQYVNNTICCAYYSADKQWHRAVVCGREDDGKVICSNQSLGLYLYTAVIVWFL